MMNMFFSYEYLQHDIVCTPPPPPPLKLGGSWNFGILSFWGRSKYFWFQGGGVVLWGGIILCMGEVSSYSVHFLILKCKISKIEIFFACGALIFNIHIFRFKTDAGLQVGIDFITESKFSFSRSSFSSPLSGHSKPTKPMKLLSFLSIWLVGLKGPRNHSVSKARAFWWM